MNKKGNSIKVVKVPLNQPLDNGEESDNEIEYKPQPQKKQAEPIQPVYEEPPKPIRKKPVLSEDERERRRQSMLQIREKKMENAKVRQQERDLALKAKEDEMYLRALKKVEQERKKQEKQLVKKLLYEEPKKKKQPKVIYQEESEEDEEEEPEPIIIKKKTTKKGGGGSSAPPSASTVYQQPVQQQPQPQYPAFRWV